MKPPPPDPAVAPAWQVCLLGPAETTQRLRAALAGCAAFAVSGHESPAAARAAHAVCRIDLALVSVPLAERHADELFGRLCPERVAVYADRPEVDAAVRWLRAGAVDYFALDEGNLAVLPERLRRLLELERASLADADFRHRDAVESLRRAHAALEERVLQRNAELAASNASLRRLLETQEMNIGLAHQVLSLINATQPRNTPLRGGLNLFTAAQTIPRHLEGGDHGFVRRLGTAGEARTLLSLKDQSGHEVGCILRSIITDLVHHALLGAAGTDAALGAVVTRLNREICRTHLFADGDFFTALALEVDHATLRLDYVAAGHPPFLLIRGTEVQLLPALGAAGTNPPMGLLDQQEFSAARLQLQPGDKLLLYTDGLLEAPAARHGGELSSTALLEHVRALAAARPSLRAVPFANALFQAVAGCTCGEAAAAHGMPDDIALVVLELERPAVAGEDFIRPADLADLHAHRIRLLAVINEEWQRHGVTAAPLRLQVVFEEALNNAWRHGNREDPAKAIRVRRRYGNDACLEIMDEGAGFAWERSDDPTLHANRAKPSGRGLFLIRRFADEVRWSDGGRRLTAFFGDERSFGPPGGRTPTPPLDLWQPPLHSPP